MNTSATELTRFHDFVSTLLAQGRAGLLPEDVLDAWREEHPRDDEHELNDGLDDEQAVLEAIAERDAGHRGTPVDEVMERISREFGLHNPRKPS
ncbi:MAG: hypothetical protein JNJ77_15230 [Planctomycetia bacterium]|nr:hypothetical protein [Planctomycetia bacterium]